MLMFLAAAAVLLAVACGGNSSPAAHRAAGGDEGAAAALVALPTPEEQKALSVRGEEVYKKFVCGSCHAPGSDRQGLTGPPLGKTAERHLARQKGDELAVRRWFWSHVRNPEAHPGIYHGDSAYSAKMPGYPQIPDEELRALVEFLMTKR
ncbi:cytochrome c [bacterium]|nr:MAG: cytochrome c [bacterium]RIK65293.1 MAG: hypothetical protein DCC64_01235 [Planctomycetota bacterium]